MARLGKRLARSLKPAVDAVLAALTVAMLKTLRLVDANAMSNLIGGVLRRIGPLLPEHRVGRANLAAAYPEKSPAEIEAILRGVWENLGRYGAEFANIDRLWDYGKQVRGHRWIVGSEASERIGIRLRDDGKPALGFSAHLANWELSAVACHQYGVDTTLLYRRPNLSAVSDAVIRLRGDCMGTLVATSWTTAFELARALENGSHVAMLVDQYHVQGVEVTFFGRKTRANPLIARLARHYECPIHGMRVVRHPGNQLEVLVTEEIAPARDAGGKIDVAGTTQIITSVVEGWVREHPEQWLWLHRRWRND